MWRKSARSSKQTFALKAYKTLSNAVIQYRTLGHNGYIASWDEMT